MSIGWLHLTGLDQEGYLKQGFSASGCINLKELSYTKQAEDIENALVFFVFPPEPGDSSRQIQMTSPTQSDMILLLQNYTH